MALDPAGLVPFSESGPLIPTIVLDGLGPASVPLSYFPDWVNDGGVPAFGGAQVVSIFEDGVTEGTDTLKVASVVDGLIASTGAITLPNPDPSETYRVRLRFRSVVGDPNYVDRVVVFRVATRLMVPFALTEYADDQIPGIEQVGSAFRFTAPVGAFPDGEIRLHDGLGGIVLPSAAGVDWSDSARDFLTTLSQRLRRFPLQVEFASGTGVEGHLRVTYLATYTAAGNVWSFSRLRTQRFSNWGRFNGGQIDFASASVDFSSNTALLTFARGAYSLGPRFSRVVVIGQLGSRTIDPKLVIAGGSIDISSVVDFSARSHLSLNGLQDRHLLLICDTPQTSYYLEIPLRPQGVFDHVAQDGITNYFNAFSGSVLPAQPPLFFRSFLGDFIEVPNLTTYYDPTTALLSGVGTLPAPQVTQIEVYDEAAVVPSVVYSDPVDLFNQMFTVQLPEHGITVPYLDRRTLRRDGAPFTPISPLSAYLRVVMTVDQDGDPANAYTGEFYYTLNQTGQPTSWKLPLTVASVDAPALTFNQDDFSITMVIDPGSAITPEMELHGDLAFDSIMDLDVQLAADTGSGVTIPGTTTIPRVTLQRVASNLAEFVELVYTVAGVGTFRRRLALQAPSNRVIVGSALNSISAFFTGQSIVFRTIGAIDTDSNGERHVALVGDGPPLTLYNVTTGVPYFFNTQGASTLSSRMSQDWIDVVYASGGVEHRMRIYSNFFDARSGRARALAISGPGWGGAGHDYQLTNFAAPGMRFDLTDGTVEFEPDLRVYDFTQWRLVNLSVNRTMVVHGKPTTGRRYQIGSVLSDAAVGGYLLFQARHRNGTQRCFKVRVGTFDEGFQQPVSLEQNAVQ